VTSEAPEGVVSLAGRRAEARASLDFAAADELRVRIAELGWTIVDEPDGRWRLEAAAPPEGSPARRIRAHDVGTILDRPAIFDVSLHWVVEGWPDDVERAIASFRAHASSRSLQFVVADVTGEDPDRWGEDVEVVSLEGGTGWGAARNAGLKRTLGRTVLVLDGSIEATGDVLEPLEAALADDTIGVCGPFGIVTEDLRQFDEAPDPGDCDAIEGYLMAVRREILTTAGLFDEKFKWYRTADIEYSFRVKDRGLRAVVVPTPVTKHQHRMWFETDPADRARWSKRNYYRFLERFRGRYDLCVHPNPPAEERRQDRGPG
jgi:cysteinyl-tRNA synthetase